MKFLKGMLVTVPALAFLYGLVWTMVLAGSCR